MSYRDAFALDVISRATKHLHDNFSFKMTRAEAEANFNARAILFICGNAILAQHNMAITRKELDTALAKEPA